VRYIANDNVSGSSIVMDASGTVVEALDYYPYGGQRVDSKTNYGGVRNKYAGTLYDTLSGLNYMQARYFSFRAILKNLHRALAREHRAHWFTKTAHGGL
jgi:hypothetical protein